jgi:hypothetical protein
MDTQPNNQGESWEGKIVDARVSRWLFSSKTGGGVSIRDFKHVLSITKQEWPIVFIEKEDENRF